MFSSRWENKLHLHAAEETTSAVKDLLFAGVLGKEEAKNRCHRLLSQKFLQITALYTVWFGPLSGF